jgi:hypothetical protein
MSMNSKKPTPLLEEPSGVVCPVCGKKSYSLGGIHPQCAVQQADAPRQALLAAEKKEKRQRLAEIGQQEAAVAIGASKAYSG